MDLSCHRCVDRRLKSCESKFALIAMDARPGLRSVPPASRVKRIGLKTGHYKNARLGRRPLQKAERKSGHDVSSLFNRFALRVAPRQRRTEDVIAAFRLLFEDHRKSMGHGLPSRSSFQNLG